MGRLRCLTPPTPTLRPALKQGAMWRLVSHLSLNHLSLEGGREGAEALREILKLYDFADSEETRTMIHEAQEEWEQGEPSVPFAIAVARKPPR